MSASLLPGAALETFVVATADTVHLSAYVGHYDNGSANTVLYNDSWLNSTGTAPATITERSTSAAAA